MLNILKAYGFLVTVKNKSEDYDFEIEMRPDKDSKMRLLNAIESSRLVEHNKILRISLICVTTDTFSKIKKNTSYFGRFDPLYHHSILPGHGSFDITNFEINYHDSDVAFFDGFVEIYKAFMFINSL